MIPAGSGLPVSNLASTQPMFDKQRKESHFSDMTVEHDQHRDLVVEDVGDFVIGEDAFSGPKPAGSQFTSPVP